MSRLQVGGLALNIDSIHKDRVGEVVTLIEYLGVLRSPISGVYANAWEIKHSDGFQSIQAEFNLMPLGDKQTQDELMKELEEV